MPSNETYKVGDKLFTRDIAEAPEGSWVVRETMQFLRAKAGHSIISLTPIEASAFPVNRSTDRFTLVYAGTVNVEKTAAIAEALNCL